MSEFIRGRCLKRHQSGVTSIEYALMAALISLAIIGALAATGANTGGLWNQWTALVVAALS